MGDLSHIFEGNQRWVAQRTESDGEYFQRLSGQQAPDLLWIGCSDSRVPASEICGVDPGSMFVHRNVANLVVHTDFNCLSVLQYAVDVLRVRHIIVCGHYGCGGVQAALEAAPHGLIDNWLRNIKDVAHRCRDELSLIGDPKARAARLCERNVLAQAANLCYTTIVQDAWSRSQELTVHGWIYGLGDGILKSLDFEVQALAQLPETYRMTPPLVSPS